MTSLSCRQGTQCPRVIALYLRAVGVLDGLHLVSADPLNRAVAEDRLFFAVGVDVLLCAVDESGEQRLLDFFGPVFVVELDLVVAEAVDVEAVVGQSDLRGVCICVEVDDRVVGESLLDIADGVVHYDVSVGEDFSHRAVLEDDLLLAIIVGDLGLAVLH